jgi:hypothetical protein
VVGAGEDRRVQVQGEAGGLRVSVLLRIEIGFIREFDVGLGSVLRMHRIEVVDREPGEFG